MSALLVRSFQVGRYLCTLTVSHPVAVEAGVDVLEADCTWSPSMPDRFESREDEWAFERGRTRVMKEAGALLRRRMIAMVEDV